MRRAFFSGAVQDHYGYSNPLKLGRGDLENYTLKGDSVEGSIATALWDFYDDTPSEAGDDLNLDLSQIVSVITNYDPNTGPLGNWPIGADHPWNIQDFFYGFAYSNAYSPDVGYMWKILDERDITIPDSDIPVNPTGYTSSHGAFIGNQDHTITVNFTGAYDLTSGIEWYYYIWDNSPDTVMSSRELDYSVARTPNIENFWADDGYWYLHVYVKDNAGNKPGEHFHAGPFLVGETQLLEIDGSYTNWLSEIFTKSTSQVTLQISTYKGKHYTNPAYQIIGPFGDGETVDYTEPFSLQTLGDGLFEIKISGSETEFPDKSELGTIPINIDDTAPTLQLQVGIPNWSTDPVYVTRNTEFSVVSTDAGSGVAEISYRIVNGVDTGWVSYANPFYLLTQPDGLYTVHYRASDNLGNSAESSILVYLDNSAPVIDIIIGDPKTESIETIVEEITSFSITADDMEGSGVEITEYCVIQGEFLTDWEKYDGPFTLPSFGDGAYKVKYRSKDVLGNSWIVEVSVVTSLPPIADANGPYTMYEGDPLNAQLTLYATGSYDPDPDGKIVLYEWDLDGDGVFGKSATDSETVIPSLFTNYYENLPDGVYDVNLRVTDTDGMTDISYTTVEMRASTEQKIVISAYHNWYSASPTWDHWGGYSHNPDVVTTNGYRDIASVHYPIIGPYNSNNKEVIDYHIDIAKKNGIDSFAVDWMGPGNYIDESIDLLLEVAEKYEFKIALQYEARTNFDWVSHENRETELQAVQNDLQYVLEKYSQHNSYLHLNNKPVVCIFGIGYIEPEEWNAIFEDLSIQGYDATFIGDMSDTRYYTAFDGLYNAINPYNPLEAVNQHLESYIDGNPGKFYGSCLWPGYDDTGVVAWDGDIQIYSREDGQRYEDQWNTVMEFSPTFVMIMSFNNWNVGAEIEPSLEDGFTYLQLTSKYASRFTGNTNEGGFSIPNVHLSHDLNERYTVGQNTVIELGFSWFNDEPFFGEIKINDNYMETSKGGILRLPVSSESVGTDSIEVGNIRVNGVEFGSNFDDVEIIWDSARPTPEPSPSPSPSASPKPESPGGIPGFPMESIVFGIMLVSIMMWIMMRKRL